MKYMYTALFLLSTTISYSQIEDYIINLESPSGLVIDGTNLFYSEQGAGTISKVNITENNPTPIVVASAGSFNPNGLAIHGTDLYIADFGPLGASPFGKIFKIDLTVSNPNLVEIVSNLGGPNRLLVYNDYLFFGETNNEKISKLDLTVPNATPIIVVNDFPKYYGMAIYADHLYYSPFQKKIYRIDLTDPTATPELFFDGASVFINPLYLEVINNYLIVMDVQLDKIFYIDFNDSNNTLNEWITDVDGPIDIVVGLNSLYIAEFGGNKISKLDDINLGVGVINITNEIIIYPNPSRNFIQVSNIEDKSTYKIINMLGQFVFEGEMNNNEKINIQQLPKGVYTIVLDEVSSKKFVKY